MKDQKSVCKLPNEEITLFSVANAVAENVGSLGVGQLKSGPLESSPYPITTIGQSPAHA